ncbi:MAG TPA: glycosyltransferase family 4 protein [Patescibacteria group bacterium]|nr:glycosyltransferase family 4 protein [Patescibacteria group bacterium]
MRVGIVYQPLGTMPLPVGGGGSIAILTYEIARRLAKSCEVFVYSRAEKVPRKPQMDRRVLYQWLPTSLDNKLSRMFIDHPHIVSRALGLHKPMRPFFACGANNLEYGLRVASSLRARKCDVVHIHNYSQTVSAVRALNPRAKIVLHMHCEWLNQLDPKMIQRRLAKVNLIIGCSEFITDKIRNTFPQFAARCRTVYNGVDGSIFSPNGHSMPTRDEKKRILFVGRIVPEKGPHVLLEAFQKVAGRHPEAELVMVGPKGLTPWEFVFSLSNDPLLSHMAQFYNGNYDSALKTLEPPATPSRVSYVGNLPYPSLHECYKTATVLVCPSIWNEPYGMPVAEAMAAGLPVVATRSGGIPEIVEHEKTGLLVERGDPSSMADAILRLLEDDDLRRSMGRAGRQRVLQHFTWDKTTHNLADLYSELLADGKRLGK